MKRTLAAAGLLSLLSTTAMAETVAVSMARFDDNFLTVIRNGMDAYAKTLDGVDLQIEDAGNDVAKQLDQINNFVASGVDAIIVNPVDTSATQAMSDAAAGRRASRWSSSIASRSTSTRCPTTRPSSPRTSASRARSRPRRSAACSRKPARPRPAST